MIRLSLRARSEDGYISRRMLLLRLAFMTKAGQTCLTTCKIPMNERNLRRWSLTPKRARSPLRSRSCWCATRPRPLLNSSTSRSQPETPGWGTQVETRWPRDNVFSVAAGGPVILIVAYDDAHPNVFLHCCSSEAAHIFCVCDVCYAR